MDNSSSLLLPNIGPASRLPTKLKTPVSHLDNPNTKDALIAEHGFSAWITTENNGETHNIIFDAGVSPSGVSDNMKRLELNPKDATSLVMSHGHYDHTMGLDGIMKDLPSGNIPVVIHPDFWNKRRILIPGKEPSYLPSVSRTGLIENGFDLIEESRQPSFLLGDSLLVTGEVDRTIPYEVGMPQQQCLKNDHWISDPLTLDDQAVIINVKKKGLVVITGCGHAGIINIARYAKKITGIKKIHALIGGFHLPDQPNFQKIIIDTVQDLKKIAPDWIAPSHCTGFEAMKRISQELPTAFMQSCVGTQYRFDSRSKI
jgi:7,8-dihydropterin-6-yl-methyl-4-(beta-D-ribofuranosyl)aminobenzene 5'-phosphate synthase